MKFQQQIRVTHLRHGIFLHLTGPKFNVPGKVDMLLGRDVPEEVK